MQENNFEEQVRKLMGDLEITPGEPVWEYVDKRIPKSNRRRRFIAFFLLFAGVAVCGYFFYNKFSGNTKTVAANESIAKTKQNNGVANDATKLNEPSKDENTNATAHNPINKAAHEKTLLLDNKTAINETKNTKGKNVKQVNGKSSLAVSSSLPSEENKQKNDIVALNEIKEGKNSENENQPAGTSLEKSDANQNAKRDSTNDAIALINKPDTALLTTLSTAKKEDSKAKKDLKKITVPNKKLQLGITAFYGRSNSVESFTSGIGISDPDKSLADYTTANPGTNWDSAFSASYSKAVTAKSSYSVGVVLKKQLTSRSGIRTGFQYTRINTEVKIGSQKDTSAVFNYNNSGLTTRLENYYRPGLSGSWINKYNLLQIPIVYSYQINKSKKFPFSVNGGFTLSRIISSDALVYDSYNQAYYKNDDLFNKTQITLLGGIHANLSFIHSGTLELGPQFQYGLTNVIKNNNTKHFFLWGLNATYFFPRKK